MKLSDIRVDAAKQEEGEWVKDIPEMGDLELRVKGLNIPAYRNMQSKMYESVPRQHKSRGRVSTEYQEKITNQCLHAHILLDWKNVNDGEKDVPFSKEMSHELLTKPEYRAFRDAVIWAASTVGQVAAEEGEDDLKNSPTPSSGT